MGHIHTDSCIVGFDFGTTSLSAVVINVNKKQIEKVFCYNTDAYIPFTDNERKEQSVQKLTTLFLKVMDEIRSIPHMQIKAYGFTGQMHGIVGLNKQNEAATNLVTWQDKSGEIMLPEGIKLLDKIKKQAKTNILANGYGIVALYKWIHIDKRTDIHSFCTISDYFARLIAGNRGKVVMSPSMAHSVGLFDLFREDWQQEAIRETGLGQICFPEICDNTQVIGYAEEPSGRIPVICSIGDNQASFMGSVKNYHDSILLNVGTGTQVSFLIEKNELETYRKYIDEVQTQLRPFDSGSYLIATSFTSGGNVYKSLFNFFRESAIELFGLEVRNSDLWRNMEKTARQSEAGNNGLHIYPLLEGERKAPGTNGKITGMDSSNFHPGTLIYGFLKGQAEYYKTGYFPELEKRIKSICGSGNGLKRNTLLCEIISQTFDQLLYLTPYDEEAAVGAAMHAATAIQIKPCITL